MGRRGDVTVGMIVGIVVALIGVAILIFLATKSSGGFLDSLSCEGDGLIEKPRAEGCSGDYKPYLMGFFTEDGMTCCRDRNFEGGGSGSSNRIVNAVSATQVGSGKNLVEGQTVVLYTTKDTTSGVRISGDLKCPSGRCELWCQEKVTTAAGEAVDGILRTPLCNDGNLPYTTSTDVKAFAGQITFAGDPRYIDQQLTYTLDIGQGENVIDTYTLRVKLSSPIKYAGLTQAWSKRKEVTATCESPVTCTEILFRVQEDETKCDIPTDDGKLLETSYCIVKDGKITTSCSTTRDECTMSILALNDAGYGGAHAALMAAVNNGLIPENVAYQFATQQGKTSTYQCVKSTQGESSAGTLYRVRVDPTTERAAFTLEHQSFEGKNVCIYGKDTSGAVYAGKGPIPLKLDVTPPNAILDFRPGSLQLRYSCTDTLSGCKDTFGVAYISQTGDFLRALVAKDTPQNAAAWCPSYATATGYRVETRPIVNYADNEVRVLCLRVEDQAGNAGVAMTTVYNAYDLFANALALAIQESD